MTTTTRTRALDDRQIAIESLAVWTRQDRDELDRIRAERSALLLTLEPGRLAWGRSLEAGIEQDEDPEYTT